MADSASTKKALAAALKALMKKMPFAKITISDICDQCGMSRKSFYYHFKDKYDLVNWIFETEYYIPNQTKIDARTRTVADWSAAVDLCTYFYENREFYSKIFKLKGQNSFTEYFRDLMSPTLEMRIQQRISDKALVNFCVDFYTDAILSTIERWIAERNTIPPEEFVESLLACVSLIASDTISYE